MLDNPLRRWLQGLRGKKGQPPVLVKELHERDRRRVLRHLLALDKDDRLLRFGSMMSDDGITAYVGKLDFERDIVFGVVSNVFQLVGMGHLAFAPTEGRTGTAKAQVAEFGVSVSASARGQGVGTRLFQRAAIHCRNSDVDTLYMQCLTSNKTMMHIAKKAGMVVTREYGEADAHLELPPPSPGSVMAEALEEQFAAIDYTVKANTRAAVKFFTPRKPRQ
ncbi:MAG: GNAT family N-acetyltransferase [Massilia sp.]|jgi:GNAT superfamily N-acetyltransferase|uniref:GNAT family N-acetyltransferase n=1 Tax=Massilia sp. TaxID=1882437 RepID=UPI0019A57EDD|nr:GNAT family N-acetyltransferase [Oxalobacteraceae sp. CFBP 8761]MBD8724996.1 GNAT family N-acetyltransferase [Oxalobacteraceae sp. CFBP 13708]